MGVEAVSSAFLSLLISCLNCDLIYLFLVFILAFRLLLKLSHTRNLNTTYKNKKREKNEEKKQKNLNS